jgi:1-acyl-sn-glycerol-3-phosphate acyltransferase
VKKLNYAWRLIATGFSFVLFGLVALLLALSMTPLIRLFPSASPTRKLTRHSIQKTSWCYVRIMRCLGVLSFQLENIDRLNRPGILVIANHPTLLDAIFLMSVMPDTTFIVKAAMARNLITRWIVKAAGYIPNDEVGVELLEKAAVAIRSGNSLMIFPEGTRTEDSGIKFKRGAANIALIANCPIAPVVIDCNPVTLRKCDKWYQLPPYKPHFHIKVLPEVSVSDLIDCDQPSGIQARHLTRALETILLDELQRLR